jgi:hypothetical protein
MSYYTASLFAHNSQSDVDGGYLSDVIPSQNSNMSSDQDLDLLKSARALDSQFPSKNRDKSRKTLDANVFSKEHAPSKSQNFECE